MPQQFSAERLRSARVSAGLTRERLAVEVGRSYQSVVSYELDRVVPPTDVVARLAASCGVDVADLFDADRTVGVG